MSKSIQFIKSIVNNINSLSIIVLLLSSTLLHAQWNQINIPGADKLYDFDVNGQKIIVGSQSTIFQSQDDGMNWNSLSLGQITIPPYDITGLKFTSENSIIATGFFLTGNSQSIFKSYDNGLNWKITHQNNFSFNLPRAIYSLDFINNNVAYAAGLEYGILKTVNGGDTWNVLYNLNSNVIQKIDFNSKDRGLAMESNKLYLSVNGGNTWEVKNFLSEIYTVAITESNRIYISISEFILTSNNMGDTWDSIPSPIPYFNDILPIGNDSILAASDNGIYLSSNGGISWEIFPKSMGSIFVKIKKIDNQYWALSKYGKILRSSNLIDVRPVSHFTKRNKSTFQCEPMIVSYKNFGHPSWKYQWFLDDTLYSNDFEISYSLQKINAKHKVTLISNSSTGADTLEQFISYNIGATPTIELPQQIEMCNGHSYSFHPVGKNINIIDWYNASTKSLIRSTINFSYSGLDSTRIMAVVRSQDNCKDTTYVDIYIPSVNEQLWTEGNLTNSPLNLTAIDINDNLHGFAIDANGKYFLKTIDQGDSWQNFSLEIKKSDHATIDFVNDSIGFISSNGLYSTKNGGVTWLDLSAKTGSIQFIKMLDQNIGFALRKADMNLGNLTSILFKTSDGGQNWKNIYETDTVLSELSINPNGYISCIGKLNTENVVIYSIDEGSTINKISMPQKIKHISFIDPMNIYAISDSGEILNTVNGGLFWDRQKLNTSSLVKLSMINKDIGYALGINHIFKTVNGGNCWTTQQISEKYTINCKELNAYNENTIYIAGDATSSSIPKILRLTTGPYFLPKNICVPDSNTLNNISDKKGYSTFEWYINDSLVSKVKDLKYFFNDSNRLHVKLIGYKGTIIDSFEREIIPIKRPITPKLTNSNFRFCAGEILGIKLQSDSKINYSWNIEPKSEIRYSKTLNDSLTIIWELREPNTFIPGKISIIAQNEFVCNSDPLIIEKPILQGINIKVSKILDYLCAENDTSYYFDTISIEDIPFDTVIWNLNSDTSWRIFPMGNQCVLKYKLKRNVSPSILEILSYSDCFNNGGGFEFYVLTKPEFISGVSDRNYKIGDQVYLNPRIKYNLGDNYKIELYKNGVFVTDFRDVPYYYTGSFEVSDTGTYHYIVYNACDSAISKQFKIGLLTSNTELSSSSVYIYPNVSKGTFNIVLNKPENQIELELIDFNGKKINLEPVKISELKYSVITSSIPNGFYTLKIKNNATFISTNKIIIIN